MQVHSPVQQALRACCFSFVRMLMAAVCSLLSAVFPSPSPAATSDIYVPFRWQVNTARPAKQTIEIQRGETISIEPQYLTYDSAYIDLTACYEVRLRYRSADMPADTYYSALGEVVDAALGKVRIVWSSTNEAAASSYAYDIKLSGSDSASLKASGTIKLLGSITGTATNTPSVVTGLYDWAGVEHVHIDAAPFVNAGDMLAVDARLDGHDVAISNVVNLVGSGVAVVTSNLEAHVEAAADTNAAQDALIQQALESANMGGDVTGVSTGATVVATRGRTLPLAADVPADMEAIVWDAALGRYVHGSVDLSGLEEDIATLQETKAGRAEYQSWTNSVMGMIDGNDHNPLATISFASTNWIEIDPGEWEHVVRANWYATGATIAGGACALAENYGMLVVDFTQCVSRISLTASAAVSIQVGPTASGPWTGYDSVRNNVPATNMFAVRIWASGTASSISALSIETWRHPERVGLTRDFAGLHLVIDTPDGSIEREALNLRYLWDYEPGGDVTGDMEAGLTLAKIAGTPLNISGKANGYALLYYSSVDQLRYADVATQGELDSGLALKATQSAHTTLVARVTAAEAGTSVALGGDLSGTAADADVVALRGVGLAVGAPANGQVHMYDSGSGTWIPRSLGTNANYAAGINTVDAMPTATAGFYRALVDGVPTMVLVVDRSIWGYGSTNGLTLPFGTLDLQNSNITATVRAYDGNASEPAYAFAADTDAGWYRSAANTWRYVAGGNQIAEFSPAGLKILTDKSITLANNSAAASMADIGALSNATVRLNGIQSVGDGTLELRTFTTNTHFAIRILTTSSEAGGLSVGAKRTAITCGSTEGIGLRVTIGGLAIGVETNNPITAVQYDLEDNVSAIPRSSAVVSYVGAAAAPQAGTNDTPTLVTPRWIGDEYVVHGATSIIYRAFGTTTNDWIKVHP